MTACYYGRHFAHGHFGGFFGPGAIMTGVASAAIPGAGILAAIGRGLNMYEAKQELGRRMMSPPQLDTGNPNVGKDPTRSVQDPVNYDRNPNITEGQNLRDAKNRQQLEALNTGGSGGYDDSVASTTMGDTPGSESGTY